MKVDEAKKIADKQLERLVEALKLGQSEALKSYLTAMSKMHKYSFRNLLLIFSQCPDATYVAGFNSWKRLGRWVKKGEKGIVVIVPMAPKREEVEKTSAAEERHESPRFRASYVFDVSQTEGKPMAEFSEVRGEPGEFASRLKSLISESSIQLEYSQDLGSADGVSKGGVIALKQGLSPSAEFSVLVHELAHEFMHQGENRGTKDKKVRETEAEAVAYVVSEAIGLSTETACTDYIQIYRGDVETLKESLDAIHRTATTILSALLIEE